MGGLGSHKELYAAKGERGGGCICSARAVFTGEEEEEESNPGKVWDYSSSRRAALGDLFHAVENEDREGAQSSGGGSSFV